MTRIGRLIRCCSALGGAFWRNLRCCSEVGATDVGTVARMLRGARAKRTQEVGGARCFEHADGAQHPQHGGGGGLFLLLGLSTRRAEWWYFHNVARGQGELLPATTTRALERQRPRRARVQNAKRACSYGRERRGGGRLVKYVLLKRTHAAACTSSAPPIAEQGGEHQPCRLSFRRRLDHPLREAMREYCEHLSFPRTSCYECCCSELEFLLCPELVSFTY